MRHSVGTALAAVAAGVAIAIAVPVTWTLGRESAPRRESVGAGTAARLATQAAATPVSVRPDGRPAGTARRTTVTSSAARRTQAAVPTAPRGTTARSATPRLTGDAAIPRAIQIPSVRVTAPIVSIGVDRTGKVAIPGRVDTVGWYRWAARPGQPSGSTVLVGHVDDVHQGEGAFFALKDIAAGAAVDVTTRDGRTHRYRVVAREQFPKTSVPLGDLFTRAGEPRLTLITCGGSFDRSALSYRDNIVVTAVPV